jgi:hypothetical protein
MRWIALVVVTGCGSVSGTMIDAPPPPIDAAIDAALTNVAIWRAADGLPDQACAPWTLVDTATPEDPAITSGHLILSTDVGSELINYRQLAPDLMAPSSLMTMDARVRFASGSSTSTARSTAAFGFFLGGNIAVLYIEDGAIFVAAAGTTRGDSYTAPTSDAFHDYKLEMQIATGALAVSRDGVTVLNSTAYTSTDADLVFFGDSTGYAFGVSEWTRVSHNAHVPVPCL